MSSREKRAITTNYKPKVSVIISVFNPEDAQVFHDAINSIIKQTYTNWEMILCDDGSDEKYKDLIERAASQDNRIKLIKNTNNKGLARSMNRCIRHSSGKYLARMDADDISKPERLERMVGFLDTHDEYSWVGSNTDLINENGKWGERKMPPCPSKKDFLKFSPYIHPSVIFRRELLIENGRYKTSMRGEDYELFMRFHALGYKGYNLQEPLYQYREDLNSYHRRHNLMTQLEEVQIRHKGFKALGITGPKAMLYSVKPIIIGILPDKMQVNIKQFIRNEKTKESTTI